MAKDASMRESDSPPLPEHVERTVQSIADFHIEHHRQATRGQRAVERVIPQLARPHVVLIVAAVVLAWIVVNLLAIRLGYPAFDPPPFSLLQGAVTLSALCMTILILTTQRGEDRLMEHFVHLTLEIAMVNDQRTAKLIELVEDLRRDHPDIADRVDAEAASMSHASNPRHVLEAIREIRADASDFEERGSG